MIIIHYTPTSYATGCFGGVSRFDFELKKALPNMVTILRSKNIQWDVFDPSDTVVITDHTFIFEIPVKFKVVAVHHGMAAVHKERNPNWDGDGYVYAQSKMKLRPNTWFVGISKFTEFFAKTLYNVIDYDVILHSVDTKPEHKRSTPSKNVIGDWRTPSKGEDIIPQLKDQLTEFKFNRLQCDQYHKSSGYANSSIYLCLSVSEGNSYAMMDAIACGLPVLSTDVGLFYGDYSPLLGEVIPWEQRNNISLIKEKLNHIYDNYTSYDTIKWLKDTIPFDRWTKRWQDLVEDIRIKNAF